MFNWKTITTVLSLLPMLDQLISSTVQAVESSLSGFAGNAKFAAAEAKVNTFLSTVSSDLNVVGDLQSIAGPLITAWVAAFNAAGLFTHKAAETPAPTN